MIFFLVRLENKEPVVLWQHIGSPSKADVRHEAAMRQHGKVKLYTAPGGPATVKALAREWGEKPALWYPLQAHHREYIKNPTPIPPGRPKKLPHLGEDERQILLDHIDWSPPVDLHMSSRLYRFNDLLDQYGGMYRTTGRGLRALDESGVGHNVLVPSNLV